MIYSHDEIMENCINMNLALTFYSVLKMPISDIISCAVDAEKAGFSHISVAESFYRDAAVLGTAIATNTTKIKFGSSIFPIPTRTPFQIAMATATLSEISCNRVGFIGLGVGYRSRIEKYFGIKIENSLDRMKEYVTVLKGLLSGEDYTYRGEFFSFENFPKLTSHRMNTPILFGSSGPKMIELAGQIADGLVLNSIGMPDYFKEAISIFQESVKRSNRKKRKFEIAASVIYSVDDKYEKAIKSAKPDVLFYVLYPELNPVIEKTPYVERIKKIRKEHSAGNYKQALSLISDEMMEDLTIAGTPKECRKKLQKIYGYGITMPIIRVSVQTFKENQRKDVFLKAIQSLSKM